MIHHLQIMPGHHHGGHKAQFLEEFEAQSGACVLALVHVHVDYFIIKDCRMVLISWLTYLRCTCYCGSMARSEKYREAMQQDIDAKISEMIAARDDLRRVMDDMKA